MYLDQRYYEPKGVFVRELFSAGFQYSLILDLALKVVNRLSYLPTKITRTTISIQLIVILQCAIFSIYRLDYVRLLKKVFKKLDFE